MSNLLLRKTNQRFGPGVRLGCLMLGNISFKKKNWEKLGKILNYFLQKRKKITKKQGFCSYHWDSLKDSLKDSFQA